MTMTMELGLAAWRRFVKVDDISFTEIVCKIVKDEADIVLPTSNSCFYDRTTEAICAPATGYIPVYFFSKYPAEKSPIWNLLIIIDEFSWLLTFLSILFVSIFFLLSAKICSLYFGVETFSEEIILSPFRNFWSSNL